MHPIAILHEVQQLYNVSDRLDSLAGQHPLVSEALITISGSVRNTATLLEVLALSPGSAGRVRAQSPRTFAPSSAVFDGQFWQNLESVTYGNGSPLRILAARWPWSARVQFSDRVGLRNACHYFGCATRAAATTRGVLDRAHGATPDSGAPFLRTAEPAAGGAWV